ncbi:MAG TPA: uroporphyrinogen decarboxylase family protein [Clostridia bacterium]|nr:uroporphyrinogen decarboxylase family protein [Clostridia bacterium]
MIPLERLRAAMSGVWTDRPPMDYSACRRTDEALRQALGAENEAALLDALGSDFFYLPARDLSQNEGYRLVYRGPTAMDAAQRVCPLGIRYLRGALDHKFMVDEALEGPLAHAETPEAVWAHPFPTARDFDFSPLRDIARTQPNRVRVGGLWSGILGDSYRMMGFERFLLGLYAMPDMVHALVERMTQMYLELNEAYFEAVRNEMDVWFFGNDFGSQMGLLMSRSMWQDFFFDPIQRLCKLAHSHGLIVMMHSCGGIAPIVGDLIQAGVDILDPVQTSAKGMEPRALREAYGGRIVFHGGVDTQFVLPQGTPEAVTRHARAVIDALSPGYIFAPSQILGEDIPTQNILAAYAEARRERAQV